MNKIILFSLVCTGFLATMPVAANALDAQTVNQNFNGEPNVRLAQFRRNQNRRYYVYYRSPHGQILTWVLDGFHVNRRDAERAARRLERRGYRTDIRERREADHHDRWGWGRDR